MATTLSSTFRLDSSTGTDPVNISLAPTFSLKDPAASGSLTTVLAVSNQILSVSVTDDVYLLIRNTGASTNGNVLVTAGLTSNNIGLLKPQDFLFLPLKGGVGANVIYDTAITTLDWFYWTRS